MTLSSMSFTNKDNLTDIVGTLADSSKNPTTLSSQPAKPSSGKVTASDGTVITLGNKGSYGKK